MAVIASVGIFNYFAIPKDQPMEQIGLPSPHRLIIKELYLSAGIAVLGVILLLAGTFASNGTKNNKENS